MPNRAITAIGQSTDWVEFVHSLAIQVTGPATAVTLVVERSTIKPDANGAGGNPAPVGSVITGNPSTGLEPQLYEEPGRGWWRARCTAITGASVLVDLTGRQP